MLLIGSSIKTNKETCVFSLFVQSQYHLQKVTIKETLLGYTFRTLKVKLCQPTTNNWQPVHPDLAASDIAKSEVDLSSFGGIPNINPLTLKAVVSFLAETKRHDLDSEEQRFQKPWIQSNALTDRLAADARLLNSVNSAVLASEGKEGEWSCIVWEGLILKTLRMSV